MRQTLDFMSTAANGTGYGPDGGRLVQWWFWYILYDPDFYPTGNRYVYTNANLHAVGNAN